MADRRPATADHGRHDAELIARVAAGDGAGSDERAAQDLRSTCDSCEQLDADLRAIAAATRALTHHGATAPAPRDFRISAADAARLRPDGLVGLRSWIGSGGARLSRTLGGGLVAIGVVGILAGSGALSLMSGFGSAGAAPTSERLDQKGNASFGALIAPAQSPAAAPSAGLGATMGDQSGPARTGWVPPAWNGTLVVLSAVVIVVGLALLLAARNGRRAGP